MNIETQMYLFSLFNIETKNTAAPSPTLATKTTVPKSDPQFTTTEPTKYSVRIFASTKAGDGSYSKSVRFFTNGRKYKTYIKGSNGVN